MGWQLYKPRGLTVQLIFCSASPKCFAVWDGHSPRRADGGVLNSACPLQGKRIVSEKCAESFPGPGRVPDLSEEEMDHLVAFRRGRRMQIAITMDNKEKVSAVLVTGL